MNKVQATKAGKNLLKKMKGKGWKVEIWKNIDWQYHIVNGPVQVFRAGKKGKYSCKIIFENPFITWTTYSSSYSPNKVVMHEIKHMREELTKFFNVVESIMEQ